MPNGVPSFLQKQTPDELPKTDIFAKSDEISPNLVTPAMCVFRSMDHPENTHLIHMEKFHCETDLLFDRFGSNRTSKSVVNSTLAKLINPNL